MQANRSGIFLATIGDKGVAPTGPNNLTTFTAQYNLIEELQEGGFIDIQSEAMTIIGYHYIEKKEGGLNEKLITRLKEATGWDGRDIFWLEDSLPADLVVKITIELEPASGTYKEKLKVAWINHKDDEGTGGITKSTAADRAAIKNKVAGKLLAAAGGKPAPKQTPPAGKPSMPAKSAGGPPKRTTPTEEIVTQADAWAAFTSGTKPEDEAKIGEEWNRIFSEFFGDKGDDDLKSADWKKMRDEGPAKIIPF